jgi:hypothetical protein
MRARFLWPGWRGDDAPWALELIIVLSMLLLVAVATPIGSHIGSISPHPFWIPVLLLSSQYGTIPGIAAVVASMALHWLVGMQPQAGGEDVYDHLYRVWREPMLWPVAAIVLGSFRDQHAQKTEGLRCRLVEADARLLSIRDLAEGLRSHCEALERRMACGADRSIETGLAALEDVREASRQELKLALPRAMQMLVGTANYLLLTSCDGRLVINAELSCVQDDACKLPPIECLPERLESELLRSQRLLSIRSIEDVHYLAGVALIAAPILSPTGERLSGVLLVREMDPMRITDGTELSLRVLCRALSHTVGKGRVLLNLKRERKPARFMSLVAGRASAPL